MISVSRFCVGLLIGLCFPVLAAEPSFPPPPRLATTPAELAQNGKASDFTAIKAAALKTADGLLEKPITLPDGPGGWIFNYACPDDGTALQPLSLTEHKCPKCGKVYTDERFAEAYRCELHYGAERAALALGWAYAYSGDEKYVPEEKRILLKLAHDYPGYPQRHDRWRLVGPLAKLGGRRYVQSLDEGVGIISLAKGYDLTRNSKQWSAAEKTQVERDLFGLTAQTLLEANQDINNHQTWYNAGLMAIADVTADAALVDKVLTMKGGVYDQLDRSVTADGLWYEGTQAYHNYALSAMISIADTARRLGVPISDNRKFKSLFTGPLHATYPNGDFPVINDSDPINIHSMDTFFLWAWKTYQDPLFAQAYAEGKPGELEKLLGPDAKPATALSTQSENLSDAGLVVLRSGQGPNAVAVFMDYGPHGGGHGHYDKLNMMLFANGREWLLDPGRIGYSHKEYQTWAKETVAHNTVVLDGRSQQAATGQLTHMSPGLDNCEANAGEAYPDAKVDRFLRIAKNVLVDIVTVKAPPGTQVDLVAHAIVSTIRPVGDLGPGTPFVPGTANGYQHLINGLAWDVSDATTWEMVEDATKADGRKLRMWFANSKGEKIITATGIGYRADQPAPCIIRRRITQHGYEMFVTLYDISPQSDYIKSVRFEKNNFDLTTTIVINDQDRINPYWMQDPF